MRNLSPQVGVLVLVLTCIVAAPAQATLTGTIALTPGTTVLPGDASGAASGTLLASLSAPFTTSTGTSSGTLLSAVFREAGGTLDFYYQITNNTTSTNCGGTKPT